MKKLFGIILVLVMGSAFLVGCNSHNQPQPNAGDSSPPTSNEKVGKIVIGLDDNFPPMGFRDSKTHELVGFDIDLATETAKRINMEVEFKPIDWDSKELELTTKRVDVLWNGLTINESRKASMLFTKPYLKNRQILMVKKDSEIASKADLKGKIVGLQKGSSAVAALDSDVETKKSLKSVSEYSNNLEAFADLEIGRNQAVVLDEIVANYYVVKNPDKFKVLDISFASEDYGVATRLEDVELNAKIQKAMDDMIADGTAAEISKKWFGEDKVVR